MENPLNDAQSYSKLILRALDITTNRIAMLPQDYHLSPTFSPINENGTATSGDSIQTHSIFSLIWESVVQATNEENPYTGQAPYIYAALIEGVWTLTSESLTSLSEYDCTVFAVAVFHRMAHSLIRVMNEDRSALLQVQDIINSFKKASQN